MEADDGPPDGAATARTGWPARARRWLRTPDGRAVAVLVGLPLVVFVVPALFGHPAIAGDNVIQNFPLRTLSGRLVRQGHLPLWNPYIWSGSPLLGGLNGGSAYPFTFVFAVLAPVAAWVVNLLAVYWAAGLGVYVVLRQYKVRALPGVLAGLTYAFAGTLSGQMVHLGVVQGMAWIPWLLLAQLRLSWAVLGTGPRPAAAGRPPRPSPWPWVTLLAGVLGLIVLTGEPRSMAEAEVVASAVGLWLLLHPHTGWVVGWRRRAAFVGYSALAAAWGVALAAVQIVPGWSFINASQRSNESYQFFGSGSLRPAWTALLLVPDLFGGDGLFHQPTYFNNYNLPEVTGYVGILPLVAAAALLVRCVGRRRDPRAADWGMWLALAGLGLLLTWGSYTPLGHLFVHIPLFGKTRLQSRNLGIVDLALAVLLGFWADRALSDRPAEAGVFGRARWAVLAPAVAAGILCLVAVAVPGPLEEAFGTTTAGGPLGRAMTPWLLGQLGVVAIVVALVLGWHRLGRPARHVLLAVVVVADVGFFMLSSSTGLSNGDATLEPTPTQAAAVLGTTGRFAIYDTTGPDETLNTIGQPDLNVFTTLPSVMGYGSIVSNAYATATGTHTLDTLDPCALADGDFAPLRLSTILTRPNFLAVRAPASGQAPPAPAACPGAPLAGTAGRRTLYLGEPLEVVAVSVVAAGPAGRAPLRVGVLGPSGATTWPTETVRRVRGGWSVELSRPSTALGLVVSGPARAVSDASVVTLVDGQRIALDGALQDALSTTDWRLAGTWRGFVRFTARRVAPPVWADPASAGARVRQVSSGADGGAVVSVASGRPVTVVRSEAYVAGWHAEAVPAGGGTARTLPVDAVGLVQGVRVPAGRWTLTFDYRPKGLHEALAASGLGVLAVAAAGVVGLRSRRRRRRAAAHGSGR